MDAVVKYRIKVDTKLFCSCFEGETCPVCRRIAGMLPMLNSEALRKTNIAATKIKCKLSFSSFYRIGSVNSQAAGFVRSTCFSPIGENGSLEGIKIDTIYLEEDIEYHGEPCGGMPLLCFRISELSDSLLDGLTSLLRKEGLISGKPTVVEYGEDIISSINAEPDLDMCMVPIDPYTAEQLHSIKDIQPQPIEVG